MGRGKGLNARITTVDRSITSRATKNPRSPQTRVSEWGSLLPPEPENQAPRGPSESSLSSIIDSNPGFHDSVLDSASIEGNHDSHTTPYQVLPPDYRATPPSTIPQPTHVVHLAPAVTTTTLNFSKYPDYVYSKPTCGPRNGWI